MRPSQPLQLGSQRDIKVAKETSAAAPLKRPTYFMVTVDAHESTCEPLEYSLLSLVSLCDLWTQQTHAKNLLRLAPRPDHRPAGAQRPEDFVGST